MNQNIVTETSSNLRALARVALRGNWKLAIAATAVYLIALEVPSTILDILFGGQYGTSPLSGIYTFLVTGPFTLGYSIFTLSLFRKKETEISQVFYGFEKFLKSLGLYFVMMLFVFLWSILLIVPGIIALFRYSQAFLIMADHPEYGIMQCLSESKRIMTGNKGKLFALELSFIGWALLAAIPVGVVSAMFTDPTSIAFNIGILVASFGYIGLLPYLSIAGVAFYEIATGNLKPGVIEADAVVLNDVRPAIQEENTTTEENKDN